MPISSFTPRGYTTIQDIENYTLTEILDTFEPNVTNWIAMMEAYIEKKTGRVFIADGTASARYFSGNGRGEIEIDDAVAVTAIESYDDYGALYHTFLNTEYAVQPYNSLPIRRVEVLPVSDYYFDRGQRNVKVTAKWGYTVAVPPLISFATMVLVAGIINFSNNADGEISAERIGEYSVTYKNDKEWADFDRAKEIIGMYTKHYV